MTPSATALFAGTPAVGDLDQAFLFLTVAESGAADTCLLSRMELRPASYGLGIELTPMRYRVAERLRVAERWDRTDRLLGLLDDMVSR
jgi:hypothetical protein